MLQTYQVDWSGLQQVKYYLAQCVNLCLNCYNDRQLICVTRAFFSGFEGTFTCWRNVYTEL